MPWELPEVLDPDLAREGLKQLDPINHIACTLMPDPLQPFARVATLEVLLVHAQSAAAGYRLGEHGAFAGGSCAARRCRAVRKTRGHGARHRSAEYQVSIGGSEPTGRRRLARYQRRKTGFRVPIAKWIDRQQQSLISEWKRIPLLRSPRCHWSRRWAYSVACGA